MWVTFKETQALSTEQEMIPGASAMGTFVQDMLNDEHLHSAVTHYRLLEMFDVFGLCVVVDKPVDSTPIPVQWFPLWPAVPPRSATHPYPHGRIISWSVVCRKIDQLYRASAVDSFVTTDDVDNDWTFHILEVSDWNICLDTACSGGFRVYARSIQEITCLVRRIKPQTLPFPFLSVHFYQ